MEIIKKLYSQKIILFTLALIINSCGVYVQFDYDSDVNFNNYNSYSFYEPDIEKVEISDLDKKSLSPFTPLQRKQGNIDNLGA